MYKCILKFEKKISIKNLLPNSCRIIKNFSTTYCEHFFSKALKLKAFVRFENSDLKKSKLTHQTNYVHIPINYFQLIG